MTRSNPTPSATRNCSDLGWRSEATVRVRRRAQCQSGNLSRQGEVLHCEPTPVSGDFCGGIRWNPTLPPHGCATITRRPESGLQHPRNRSRLVPGCQSITISPPAAVSKGHERSSLRSSNVLLSQIPYGDAPERSRCSLEAIGDDRTGSLLHAMRYSPFPICRILKAPRVDLAFTHALIPRLLGGFSYYHNSILVSPGHAACVALPLVYLGPFRDDD